MCISTARSVVIACVHGAGSIVFAKFEWKSHKMSIKGLGKGKGQVLQTIQPATQFNYDDANIYFRST